VTDAKPTSNTKNSGAKAMIDIEKTHKTRSGCPVRILCTDRDHPNRPVVALAMEGGQEIVVCLTSEGKIDDNDEREWDLLEVTEWDSYEVDEVVMVRGMRDVDAIVETDWWPRYFAGVGDNNKPRAWHDGKTSLTSGGMTTEWEECRRPKDGELKQWTKPRLN
jgi:hypothetical protein